MDFKGPSDCHLENGADGSRKTSEEAAMAVKVGGDGGLD